MCLYDWIVTALKNWLYLSSSKRKSLIDNIQDVLYNKSIKLYQKCTVKLDFSLVTRFCDFKILENSVLTLNEQILDRKNWKKASLNLPF